MSLPPLVLASTSRYRAELLGRLQLPFEVMRPAVIEDYIKGESPSECATRLAMAKATAIAALRPDACVIGSDQVADWDGRVLGKPGSVIRAVEQLTAFSGQSVHFHTAVCVMASDGQAHQALDTTTVQFRTLSADEITRYVDCDQPLDCAGSFRSEGLGVALFERIASSDPTALIGLPLIATAMLLRRAGFAIP